MSQLTMMRIVYPNDLIMTWAIPDMTLMGLFVDFYEKNESQSLGFFLRAGDRVLDCARASASSAPY